jgi:hypothetical protein
VAFLAGAFPAVFLAVFFLAIGISWTSASPAQEGRRGQQPEGPGEDETPHRGLRREGLIVPELTTAHANPAMAELIPLSDASKAKAHEEAVTKGKAAALKAAA